MGKTMPNKNDLDYRVIYPKDGNAEQDKTYTEKKRPVIYLLGWYGCKDKHLVKYSAIYQSKGYITIHYILPNEYFFSAKKGGNIRQVAVKVLDSLFDLGLEKNPIFFHLFSNGGGYVYRYLTELLQEQNPRRFSLLKVCGVIFDSAPCRPTFGTAYKVVRSAMPPSQHWFISTFLSWVSWVAIIVISFLPQFQKMNQHRISYFGAMMKDRISCPQLFLYSKADHIAGYLEIQEVIEARRRGGFEVREVLWDDSAHVSHLLKHSEEYASVCLEFIADCVHVEY